MSEKTEKTLPHGVSDLADRLDIGASACRVILRRLKVAKVGKAYGWDKKGLDAVVADIDSAKKKPAKAAKSKPKKATQAKSKKKNGSVATLVN